MTLAKEGMQSKNTMFWGQWQKRKELEQLGEFKRIFLGLLFSCSKILGNAERPNKEAKVYISTLTKLYEKKA